MYGLFESHCFDDFAEMEEEACDGQSQEIPGRGAEEND